MSKEKMPLSEIRRIFERGEFWDNVRDVSPGDLTDEEKERRARAKAIPEAIVAACKSEYSRLRGEVIEREAKMDAIDRFLTGEKIAGYHDEHEPAQ